MGRLAVTGGHGILGTEFAAEASRLDIDTIYGPAALLDAGSHVVIQRHGLDEFVVGAVHQPPRARARPRRRRV